MASIERGTAPTVDGGMRCIVTGGTRGVGAAIVEALRLNGASVAAIARSQPPPETADSEPTYCCDVTDEGQVTAAVAAIASDLGGIDALVNSAGIALLADAEDLTLADWKATIDTNLTGSFIMSRAVGRVMLEQGSGRIVNLSSQAGIVALPRHAAYCASKAGVLGLTRSLALEWGPKGVTVNAVSPTVVLTDMGRKAWTGPHADALKQRIPTRRFAEVDDIVSAVSFLLSPGAAMINGHDLVVDGGFTIT